MKRENVRFVPIILLLLLVLRTNHSFSQDETVSNLQQLMDAVFPGNALILINGAYNTPEYHVCMDKVPFETESWYLIPQGLLDPVDYTPYRDTLFAHTIVVKADNVRELYPSEVMITVIEPDIYSQNVWPIIPGALELFTDDPFPRAEARASVQQSGVSSDIQYFLDASGDILFEFRQNGLAEERRLAFAFDAEANTDQAVQIHGAIHNVFVPPYLSYDDLPVGESNFVALSGAVYSVTYANTIHAKTQIVGDTVHYIIQFETTALMSDDSNTSPVPVEVAFTAVERGDNDFGGFDALATEIEVDGDLLSDYQPLTLYHFIKLIPEGDNLSGKVKLFFSNGCGDYIQMDLLFHNLPLEVT